MFESDCQSRRIDRTSVAGAALNLEHICIWPATTEDLLCAATTQLRVAVAARFRYGSLGAPDESLSFELVAADKVVGAWPHSLESSPATLSDQRTVAVAWRRWRGWGVEPSAEIPLTKELSVSPPGTICYEKAGHDERHRDQRQNDSRESHFPRAA